MKQIITLTCEPNIKVEVEADVVHGIGIHRPVYFEIDENDHVIINQDGEPALEIGTRYWRLTHVNSGLSIMHARTLKAALIARKMLKTIDLDWAASLKDSERLAVLPVDHELRRMVNEGDMWLPPGWMWD